MEVEILFEKRGQLNGGTDFGLRQLLYTCIGVEENFMMSLSVFLLFFGDKK